jgi:hypothetical protein
MLHLLPLRTNMRKDAGTKPRTVAEFASWQLGIITVVNLTHSYQLTIINLYTSIPYTVRLDIQKNPNSIVNFKGFIIIKGFLMSFYFTL